LKAIVRIAKEALASEARASLFTSKQAGAEPVAVADIIKDGASNTRANDDKIDVWWEFDADAICVLAARLAAPGAAIAAREQEAKS
jgi:hypothetical protein